jgi:DNA-binding CsgD family transcriptional regulator
VTDVAVEQPIRDRSPETAAGRPIEDRAREIQTEGLCPSSASLPKPLLTGLEMLAVLVDNLIPPGSGGEAIVEAEVGGYRWTVVPVRTAGESPSPLSPRESEIARMVAAGLTNRAIASVLDISPWTVSTHLRRIFTKLEVNSRAAMVASLPEHGLRRTPG